MLTTATATPTIKLISYPAIVWLFSYTGLSHEAVSILAILLALDVITALIRVAVINPSDLSSKKGIVGIVSKCLTFMIPFLIVIVGKGAGIDMSKFATMSVTVLVVFEGWSIIGNIGQIRSKDTTLNEYDGVSLLIKRTQNMFKAILDNVYILNKEGNKSNKDLN